jgi:transcriptional regulator with XRE-family HTH domain
VPLPPLAAAVRGSRLASGLTLEQLAQHARVSRSTVAKIEAGDTPDPGFSVVVRLLAAAGASDHEYLQLWRATLATRRPRAVGVGYEGLDQSALLRRLRHDGVELVADVRKTPVSRKPGLSKKALASALDAVKIRYVHLPALGNAKDNRAGYSDPANREARSRFELAMRHPTSQHQLAELRRLAQEHVVAVLCFESDERLCHREQVLAAL